MTSQNINKIVAIGDIHGEEKLLKNLLEEIKTWDWDYLVFLGDYVDRGDGTKQVINVLISLQEKFPSRVVFLKGNHEQWMLQNRVKVESISWLAGMDGLKTIFSYSPELAERLKNNLKNSWRLNTDERAKQQEQQKILLDKFFNETMPKSHLDFFLNLQNYFKLDNVLCVHAGIMPGIPLEQQKEDDILWITKDFYENYQGNETVIFGHMNTSQLREDAKDEPYMGNNNIIGIDTTPGLTAFRWPTRDFITVFPNHTTNRGIV